MDWSPTDEQKEQLGLEPFDGETMPHRYQDDRDLGGGWDEDNPADELEPGRSWAEFFTQTGPTCRCQDMSFDVFQCEAHGAMLRKAHDEYTQKMSERALSRRPA